MLTGNRFRTYPTPAQEQILLRWIGHQRFVCNAKVSEDRYDRAFAKKAVSLSGTSVPVDQEYSRFINDRTSWLRKVPSQILRNGAVLWKQAYSRFFSGRTGRPSKKRKDGRQSVWVTSELFSFQSNDTTHAEERVPGTKKFSGGMLSFVAHRPYSRPSSLHVSVEAGKWFVSFSSDEGLPEPQEEDTAAWLRMFSEEDLRPKTLGFDRGVVTPLQASDGRRIDFSPVRKNRIEKKDRARRRWQRKLARQVKGSNNRRKTKARIARSGACAKEVRKDVLHKATDAIVAEGGQKPLRRRKSQGPEHDEKAGTETRRFRTLCPKRIPGQVRSQHGDPVVRLGPVRDSPVLQGQKGRKARDPGSTSSQFAGMCPMRACSPGQPAFPGCVRLPALRTRGQCRSKRQSRHRPKGNPASSGREDPEDRGTSVRDRKTETTRAEVLRQSLRTGESDAKAPNPFAHPRRKRNFCS